MRGMKPGSGRREAPAVVSAGEPLLPSAPGCTHGRRVRSDRFGCERAGGGSPATAGRDRDSRRAVCVGPSVRSGRRHCALSRPDSLDGRSPPRGSGRPTVVAGVTARIPLLTLDTARSPARPATTTRPARGRSRRGRHAPCTSARSPCGPRAAPRCRGLTGRLCYPCPSGGNRVMLTLPVYTVLAGEPAGPGDVRRAGDHPRQLRRSRASSTASVPRCGLASPAGARKRTSRGSSATSSSSTPSAIRRDGAMGHPLPLLAGGRQVAASTQNQALSALLFLYRDVLEVDYESDRSGAAGASEREHDHDLHAHPES